MLQTQFAHHLGRCLGGDGANLVEERHATHAQGRRHLVEADLTAAHVLQHELLDITHELLVHDAVHGVVANGVAVIVFGQHVVAFRRFGGFRRFRSLGIIRSVLLHLSLHVLHIIVNHGGGGHAGIVAFEHSRLLALDDILIDFDGCQSQQLVEAHDGLLHLEGLGQVVVGSHRDVLFVHVFLGQHTVREQHKLALAAARVALELVAQLAAGDALLQFLLTDNDVGIQRLDVRQGILDIVVDMEVIDLAEVGIHEVQELAIVVNEHDAELLRLLVAVELERRDGVAELLLTFLIQSEQQVRLVEFQAVLGR